MSSCIGLQLPTATLYRLLDYLNRTGSKLDAAAAADEAIREWLSRMQQEDGKPELAPMGYFWKTLFLPEGTRLNVFCRSDQGYATVVGDKLMFRGDPISPNRFAEIVSGYVRNAWEDVMIRFPGESRPKMASMLRREQKAAAERERLAACQPDTIRQPEQPTAVPIKPDARLPEPTAWPYVDRRALRIYEDHIAF